MGDSRHGPWRPLTVDEVASVFKAATFTWFIAGGHALELALNSSWRDHADIDVGVRRDQLPEIHRFLADWDLHVAAAGQLSRWEGTPLRTERHQNNIWARQDPEHPWQLDLVVGAGTDTMWRSRRDAGIQVPWDHAIRHSGGLPHLAPQLQLLMKSKDIRPKDGVDAKVVIPRLAKADRRWLAAQLADDHPWRAIADGPD